MNEALDFLVGLGEVGGARPHAPLEAGVQDIDLVARLSEFSGVAQHGDGRAADHHDDNKTADDREPSEQRRIGPLLADSGRQPLIGDPDDAGEEYVGLVH